METDLLLLDDLGAWKMTDWMNDTLFYILNSRYLAKRATLITTNFQDADREAVLAADPLRRKEFLVERIGQRLRSRLMEMCLVVKMQGDDHRQARQAANQVAVRARPALPAAGDAPPRRGLSSFCGLARAYAPIGATVCTHAAWAVGDLYSELETPESNAGHRLRIAPRPTDSACGVGPPYSRPR